MVSGIKAPSKILKRLFRTGLYRRIDEFKAFVKQHIDENHHLYESIRDLKAANTIYDAFICGSDQIWAPNLFHEWSYLSFVDGKHRKIAYAPSIGLPTIPDTLKPRMASLIKEIRYLSVREKQGAEIINELTGIQVPIVLDPTLLINRNKWIRMLTETKLQEPYVLCYLLGE
ncbi:unnamed protein product, partial [marine sediment metagenome]